MDLKETHAVIILLSIIILSSIFKPDKEKITDNTLTIINNKQLPAYSDKPTLNNKFKSLKDSLAQESKDNKNIKSDNWLKRYNSGIRFEFFPPN